MDTTTKIDKRSKAYKAQKLAQSTDTLQQIPGDNILSALDEGLDQQPVHKEESQGVRDGDLPIYKRVRSTLSIKAYVSGEENMGLEKTGEVICPGLYQIDRIGGFRKGDIMTYITGLNEMAPEIQSIKDGERKTAKVREIRTTVAYLENTITGNYEVNPISCMANYGKKEDDFWTKVQTFKSSLKDTFTVKGERIPNYWDKVEIKLDNEGFSLNMNEPADIALFYVIEARGFSMIAPSLKVAMEEPGYKFYLDSPFETANIKTAYKKLRNEAGGYLNVMLTHDQARLFYVCKLLAPVHSTYYRRGGPAFTPPDKLYEDICDYLDGKTVDYDKEHAVNRFMEYYKMDIDELCRRAVVKDASELRLIEPRADGRLFYIKDNANLGRNMEDMIAYVENPLNESTWRLMRDQVEYEWRS